LDIVSDSALNPWVRIISKGGPVRLFFSLPVLALALQLGAQTSPDEAVIRNIIKDETDTWNKGDAVGYSRHFAAAGTFTNIRGQFFSGYPAFLKQHEAIFEGIFKNTILKQDVVSLKFIRPDVAIIETLTSVAGVAQSPPGVAKDDKGRMRTRLLQVVAKEGGVWKIVSYHNVDVKPGTPVPEPG
jgi:uncharacterized protein (TIGR02246 family)